MGGRAQVDRKTIIWTGRSRPYFGRGQSFTDRITARAIHKPEMHSCSAHDEKHVERMSQGSTDKCRFGKSAESG